MAITSKIQEKLENYRIHVLMAIDYLSKENLEEAGVRFRKSGEAFLKSIIYEHLGDTLGHDVILGLKDRHGVVQSRPNPLMYGQMQHLCSNEGWLSLSTQQLLKDLKEKSNEDAHDPNNPVNPALLKSNLETCMTLSRQLTHILYPHYVATPPTELVQAYTDGIVPVETIDDLLLHDMDTFVENVDSFDKSCRYVLISPFTMGGLSKVLLRNLMGIRWSVIIDFDSHSKETGGLYHAMEPEINDNCTPFTILNRGNLSCNMSKGTNGNVNWIFANGLSSLPGTETTDIASWLGKRMHHFLRDALTEFCRKSLSPIHIISLLDDEDYLSEVIRLFDGIDFAERDLVKFSIISNNQQSRSNLKKLSRYGFEIDCYDFTILNFMTSIGDFLKPQERHTILVPGRNAQSEIVWTDITDVYSKLSSHGIMVIHRDIVSETATPIASVPAFYHGETITWNELEADVDAQRSKYSELQRKVLERLNARQSQKFSLFHYAGAGGTTLSRRLAFDLREQVPTIIINDYTKGVTFNHIDLLSMRVNRPILAIVESSKVGNIDELIAECNAKKRMVVFVYVERVLRKPTSVNQPQIEFITDKMHDAEEKSKFTYKVQLYNNKTQSLSWIEKAPYANCEVLDFSMSISENNYDKKALRRYIKNYMDQLSEPTAEFLCYVAMVYHYAQRSVSDYMFRKLFILDNGKTGLLHYMRQHPQEMNYLKKLITDDSDGTTDERQWRPRYSLFADVILEELLGGEASDKWKNALPEWSRKLIQTIKTNYEFLTDEVQKMLVAVFLEREKEDPLGHEELWMARGAQERFSQLLEDMSYSMDDQKDILKLLADTYPTVPHFWGHLARFCYENADTPEQFVEAATYIDKALDKKGANDYNLLHIAGMCRRRQIEYYHRKGENIGLEELKALTETSRHYFRQSRDVNPKNVHAYTSEIQLLTEVIEYGKTMSKYEKYNQFLVAKENVWFFEIYEELNELIEELSSLLSQIKTLGVTNRTVRTQTMLAKSASKAWQYVGDYKESLRTLQDHMRTADRLSLPRLRVMYVRTLLLSKVYGNRDAMLEAWNKLTDKELQLVENYLNKNVQQSTGDVVSMRLWFQMVRFTNVDITVEEVKSRLKILFKSSDEFPMSKLEAAYNLYIINLFELIRDNDALNSRKKEEIQEWINACREISPNDKYPYEWLEHLDGINGIVNAKAKTDSIKLARINGTISDIKSNAQGTIRLDCGFDVFFTPSVGNFVQGKDETTRVAMVIGFRHEGPAAYEVARVVKEGKVDEEQMSEATVQELEMTEVEAIEPIEEQVVPEAIIEETVMSNKPKLKIIGKIDLDALAKYDRPKKKE